MVTAFYKFAVHDLFITGPNIPGEEPWSMLASIAAYPLSKLSL